MSLLAFFPSQLTSIVDVSYGDRLLAILLCHCNFKMPKGGSSGSLSNMDPPIVSTEEKSINLKSIWGTVQFYFCAWTRNQRPGHLVASNVLQNMILLYGHKYTRKWSLATQHTFQTHCLGQWEVLTGMGSWQLWRETVFFSEIQLTSITSAVEKWLLLWLLVHFTFLLSKTWTEALLSV